MATTPIFLLAPTPGMTFVAMPSGVTYVADGNGLVVATNGQVADQLALIQAGCVTLEPNAGGVVTTQTGTTYAVASGDNGNNLVFSNASPVTVTLPNTLPAGFTVSLYQAGSGQVTAQAATGASVVTPNVATTPGPYCALFCIVVANAGGNTAQWAVIAEPSQTGGGVVGATTLASLYTQDTSAHYAQYSVAQIFSDATAANNGFWLKTGTGNGSGNWTQQSTITLASVSAAIAAETGRAEGVEAVLLAQKTFHLWPDVTTYAFGIFDALGNPIFGLLAGGGAVGLLSVPPVALRPAWLWPDIAPRFQGDIALLDSNGIELSSISSAAISALANTAANAAVASGIATLPMTVYIWPDVAAGFGGDVAILDSNGVELAPISSSTISSIATSAANTAVTALAVPKAANLWPDIAAGFAGDVAILDSRGYELNYGAPPGSIYGTWTALADPTSSLYITAIAPPAALPAPVSLTTSASTSSGATLPFTLTTGASAGMGAVGSNIPSGTTVLSTVPNTSVTLSQNISGTVASGATITFGPSSLLANFPIASARGANASTPAPSIPNCDSRPDSNGILKWTDNGTADNIANRSGGYFTYAVEPRQFNFLGASAVAAISGITKIVVIPMIGQSLSNGTTATPFTTTNLLSRAFMFNGGPMPYQEFENAYAAPGALCQDSQLQSLVPLVEIEKPGGINGETYGGGISYWMSVGTNLEATSALVYFTDGQGGASYSANQMQQFTGTASNSMFASVIRCLERVAAWCKLNGWAMEVPCIIHDQGENDYTTNATTYYNDLVANQAAYETAINAIFTKFGLTNAGPSGPYSHIPFLCIQPSSWGFYSDATAPAMYEYPQLAINLPTKFVLIGPQYWNANYNTGSGQHMTGLGYRQCAEYGGRAIQRLRTGSASEAVYATAVSNTGLTLTVTFNTQSALQHDISVVSDPNGQWGIELTANGSNIALSSPTIVGASQNQIQFTLASSIAGMACMLGIADVAPSGSFGATSGPTTSARAPIHDSAIDTMSPAAGGLTMVNYACAQQLSFTGV